jgi:hypothetical protein
MRGRRQNTPAISQTRFSGDGHPPVEQRGFLDSIFNQGQFPSAVKEFVHPGKDPGELLMRCIFKDEREANAAILYLAKCEEFGLDRHKKILLHKLAASVSIKGVSRRELLQAVTGLLAPGLYNDGKKEKRQRGEEG